VNGLFVKDGTPTFSGGQLNFSGDGTYFTNSVALGHTAIFNTPFGGNAGPDKWGPGTAVYNGASTCGGYFTLNEGTIAIGNDAAFSSGRLEIGDVNGVNLVSLRSADSTSHTLPNKLVFNALSFSIGAGGNLTFTGPIDAGASSSSPSTISVTNITTFSGVITNTGGFTKTGPGTLSLSGASANTYGSATANGYTTVRSGILRLGKSPGLNSVPHGTLVINSGGVVQLAASNQIDDTVTMILAGGVFQTGGFNEQLGTLQLLGLSRIDLGPGASVLRFAASSPVSWTGGATLSVSNWNGVVQGGGSSQLIFGTTGDGLSSTQLAQIQFVNPAGFLPGTYSARVLASGEVVPFAVAPLITSQPTNRVAAAGFSASFTVSASGTPSPGFQWRFNASDLPGATTSTLQLLNLSTNQAGNYAVLVTNVAGSVTSATASLVVFPTAAAILSAPVFGPGSGQLQLSVTGVPGYSYEILVSSNFINWSPVQTNTAPFTFTDVITSQMAYRFYRARLVP
jgi:autotransporter-associated beta strand protein